MVPVAPMIYHRDASLRTLKHKGTEWRGVKSCWALKDVAPLVQPGVLIAESITVVALGVTTRLQSVRARDPLRQTLICSFFFFIDTVLASKDGYWIGCMKTAFLSFSTSSLIFSSSTGWYFC